jgi:DNA-binding winged helix-turn-helix (wHTH) protein
LRVRFGECLLDSDTRELFRNEEPVHLPPKAFRLLELLLENRPRAVPKDEILQKVWPDTFVSEATLASAVSDVRAAIGDDGRDSRFIRTVHGFGYSFSGETSAGAAGAGGAGGAASRPGDWCYRLIVNGREIALDSGETILGRDRGVTVWVDDESVSRRHARLLVSGNGATIEDLRSKNGTFVQGKKIEAAVGLHDGDEIRLGSVAMTIRMIPVIGSTATQAIP